jgi:folate-dependent phosphoribosylglycinamide formyltransferase PurN
VPVLPSDTPETLAARVLTAEHALYPRALAKLVAR